MADATNDSLPTADEAFGATDQQNLPTADEAFSDGALSQPSRHFINHFVTSLASSVADRTLQSIKETGRAPSIGNYLMSNLEEGAKASFKGLTQLGASVAETAGFLAPSKLPASTQQELKEEGLYREWKPFSYYLKNNGSPSTMQTYQGAIADSILDSPLASASQTAFSTLMAPVAPLFDVARETAQKEGVSPLTLKTIDAGMTVAGIAALGGVLRGQPAIGGLEHHILGSSEDVFMGHEEPSATMAEVAHKAAEVNNPPQTSAPTVPEFDINKTARNISPEVFTEYDALQVKKDTYTQWFNDFLAEHRAEAESNAPHNAEIADLQAKMEDANARKKKIYQEKIDDLQTKNASYVEEQMHPLNFSADVKNLRAQLAKVTQRIGDMAPDVREAYRRAEEFRPQQLEETLAPEETSAPQEEIKPTIKEETPEQVQSATDNIVKSVSDKLTAVGRPTDEANASAQLIAAHYKALSDMGWVKESPEEAYKKYAPEIVQGKAREAKPILELTQKKPRELQQGGARGSFLLPFGEFKGGVIGLRPTADASTFLHETGHAWLEEMRRFAKESDAPQSLRDAHSTVMKWLGAAEDQPLSRGQHEKFARGFERYMMEGVAPSKGLARVFAQFKEWLTRIYQTVTKLRSPLTDEIRGIFDKLLEANPEKTIIAPEHEPGKMAADIHEVDARTTVPAEKDRVGDTVEKEIDATAKLHEPEVADAIKAAETGKLPEAVTGNTSVAATTEFARETGTSEEPGTVATGSIGPAAGSAELRAGTDAASRPVTASTAKPRFLEKNDNIRLDLLTSDSDVKAAMTEIYNQAVAKGEWTPSSSEAITQRDIQDFADTLGIDGQKVNIDKLKAMTRSDGIPLAFRIRAARQMLKQSAVNIRDMMSTENPTEEEVSKFAEAKARHIMIAKTVSGITAEWGRAGHAFRDISAGEMRAAQEVTEFLQSATGRTFEELKREMQLGRKISDPNQISRYVKDSTQPTFADKVLWYRNNCLLSGPITHGTYLEANLVNLAFRPLETAVAARLSKFSEAEKGVVPGEAREMMYAWMNTNAFRNAAESWKEHIAVLPGSQGKKYTSLAFNQQMIEGPVGTALHQVSRSINALHSFVYTLAYEQNIASLSFRQAAHEGLEPGTTEFAARLANLRANQTPEMMDQATTLAFDEVNMGKSGPVLGKLSLFLNSNPVTRFMFPFIKMEMNVLKNTWIERSPLGFLQKDIRANLMGANGEAARDMQRAKILATSGIAGVLFTLGSQFVNGDGPSDPNKNRVWRLTHTPNSVQFGDISFSLKGLGRVGALLRFGAGIKESFSGWEGDDGDKVAHGLLEHVMHNFDSSLTDGIKNSVDLAFHHSGANIDQFIQNFATQFLPFSVGLGQVAHEVDPFIRDTKDYDTGPLGLAEGVMKAAEAKIPGLSYLVQPRIDMFGNPISRNSNYHEQYLDDLVVKRMNALHIGIGRLDPKIFGVQLSADQYEFYSQRAGVLTKETLDRLITPQFSNYPQDAQIKAIHGIVQGCRERARQDMLIKYPDLISKAVEFQRTAYGQKNK